MVIEGLDIKSRESIPDYLQRLMDERTEIFWQDDLELAKKYAAKILETQINATLKEVSMVKVNASTDMITEAINIANREQSGKMVASGKSSAREALTGKPSITSYREKKAITDEMESFRTVQAEDILEPYSRLESQFSRLPATVKLQMPFPSIISIADEGIKEMFKEAEKTLLLAKKSYDRNKNGTVTLPMSKLNDVMEVIKDNVVWVAEQVAAIAKQAQLEKKKYIPIVGEHGPVYIQKTTLSLITGSIADGTPVMLVGEPGAAKTEIGRAIAPYMERKLFHQEISGLSEVSQLEGTQGLDERNGATITTYKPTALIEALEAEAAGESVIFLTDEIARAADPSILNPYLLMLSHGEYHAVIGKKVYRINMKRFGVVATANISAGFNFSGNNRRGLDDALLDRFLMVTLKRPPVDLIGQILGDRMNKKGFDQTKFKNMLAALTYLYGLADSAKEDRDEVQRMITVRSMLHVGKTWMQLGPDIYSLAEVAELVFSPRVRNEAVMTKIVSTLESKGL